VEVTISASLHRATGALLPLVRQALDLDADPSRIDPVLADVPAPARPGIRVPGGMEGFETAARVILGQQVTVAAARTLTGRLVQALGSPVETPHAGLTRLFPSARQVADASAEALGRLGIVRQRVRALQAVAEAVASGHIAGLGVGGAPPDAAQDRGDAHLQLLGADGLGQVVGGAEIQAGDPLSDGIEGREEDDRHTGFGPQPAAHRKAIQLGKHHVEHHQIRLLAMKDIESLFAVFRADHAVARQLEPHHQHAANSCLVIYDQQGGLGTAVPIPARGLAVRRLGGWFPRGLSGGSRGGKGQRRGILQTHDRAA
jgi:hypothetical protein